MNLWNLWLQITSYVLWFPMQILVVSAILRAGARRYLVFLIYSVVTLLVAFAQIPASIARFQHRETAQWYSLLHSVGQAITYMLALAVVLNLIYRASETVATRRVIRRLANSGSLLFVAISFLVHFQPHALIGIWMTPWTRDLNFAATILDLVLWSLLLGSRNKDQRLLMLVAGMGIMFAGEAIGDGFRTVAIHYRSPGLFRAIFFFVLAADLTFLYIWWQAFRGEAAARRASAS